MRLLPAQPVICKTVNFIAMSELEVQERTLAVRHVSAIVCSREIDMMVPLDMPLLEVVYTSHREYAVIASLSRMLLMAAEVCMLIQAKLLSVNVSLRKIGRQDGEAAPQFL